MRIVANVSKISPNFNPWLQCRELEFAYKSNAFPTRVSSREFPGSRFPGNLRILAIFPVFPGIKIRDPGNSREIPGNFGFSNFPFPGK